jgi:Fe-S oxidoreductase
MPTNLYDPLAPDYLDPAVVRSERDRTFHQCSDCRVCVKLCPSFRSLFEMIDELGGTEHVEALDDSQHRRVVDECYQCKLCYVVCPYTPDQDQVWKIDFPGLMLRSLATNARAGSVSRSARLLARTDLQGALATSVAPIANRLAAVKPARVAMEKVTGISRERALPSYARERFSTWFRRRRDQRAPRLDRGRRGEVALFPSCLVEYQSPAVGRAAVGVLEHNGFACDLPDGQVCCGMPWLDAGDVDRFRAAAQRNADALLPSVEAGKPVLVAQPTCAYTLKFEMPAFLGTDAARQVADNTFEVSEYLMARHREEPLDTQFPGRTYDTIVWHAACHSRAQQVGPKSRDLMALTGAQVDMVERCSAIDGTWGLRAENVELAKRVAKPLMDRVAESDAQLVSGDCHLANGAIDEATGKRPVHPLQVLARAYGIEDDEG